MTTRFSLDVGLLLRGAVRARLAEARFRMADQGCVVTFEEHKSWLGSLFLVKAIGPKPLVQSLLRWIDQIVDED